MHTFRADGQKVNAVSGPSYLTASVPDEATSSSHPARFSKLQAGLVGAGTVRTRDQNLPP